ncbi:MAG: adenine phosphoribosyltransferase [Deltaproteobacteria bacterium]|nr:MAG: adenine phosphoribosyltransferase [Deltaproteobacteria bacterium]
MDDSAREAARARVRAKVRTVPDFPRKGILFRDITPILADAEAMRDALDLQLDAVRDLWGRIDRVCGIESRGFLFGMAIAERLGVGFVPLRKPGKLPAATIEQAYALEYGVDRLAVHCDAISPGHRVVVVDDLLATGGTAQAACHLAERLGGRVVACVVLIELAGLGGRHRLGLRRVESVLTY